MVIISAMGKTTNALEALTEAAFNHDNKAEGLFLKLYDYHMQIAQELFPDDKHKAYTQLESIFSELRYWMDILAKPERKYPYDLYYDQMVPVGELLSTMIVSIFLNEQTYKNTWLDAREMIITDNTYRAAIIDWQRTHDKIKEKTGNAWKNKSIVVSQGFIGHDGEYSTTLGREGSDFSAAIFANILDAEEVIVWKDVPGYLNADPQYFSDTVKLDRISYSESIELAFFGAKIIHPKTIRPLKNKSIPLWVRSFLDPDAKGSLIHEDHSSDSLVPSYIIKEDQVLISISPRDFSFIAEDNLHLIFGIFTTHRCGINLMQNSAISFSVCVDKTDRLEGLIDEMQQNFSVKYNDGLQLITIRHYDQASINKLTEGKEVFLEQKSRMTVQVVVK